MKPRLVCAFGSPWGARGCGPCAKCQWESARLMRQFDRDVFFGFVDRVGYAPNDPKPMGVLVSPTLEAFVCGDKS